MRASVLERLPRAGDLAGKHMAFRLGDEEFGVQILHVREIIALMEITRMPRADPCTRGVINLRGKIIPVVDLRMKLDMGRVEPAEQTVIIVVQCGNGERDRTVGLLVDEVVEVVNIGPDEMDPSPEIGNETAREVLLGVGKVADRIIFLLDIESLLCSSEAQG